MRRIWLAGVLVLASAGAGAQQEAREDAWWTGPMLAPSAATLPQGHALLEPSLFDEISNGHFDSGGDRHSGPYEHDLGSLTYILYGLTDRVTAGLIPRFLYNEPAGAPNSAGIGLGDVTLQAVYGLTQYQDGSSIPAIAAVLQETLPTGSYDRLARPSGGSGAGAYTTGLALYSQDYFWMPNGRILRARLDLTYDISSSVSVHDLSVYATSKGFAGRAWPGNGVTADAAAEYGAGPRRALPAQCQHHGERQRAGQPGRRSGQFVRNCALSECHRLLVVDRLRAGTRIQLQQQSGRAAGGEDHRYRAQHRRQSDAGRGPQCGSLGKGTRSNPFATCVGRAR
jgi:hypothetical protein